MAQNAQIRICYDPFILRMAHHSVAMPEFRKQMAGMMKENTAFVYKTNGGCVTVHPSDQLLDSFYCGMGLK